MIRLAYFFFLLAFWVICTGIYGFKKLLFLSLLGVLVSLYISHKINMLPNRLYSFVKTVKYSFWIIIEMVKSSLIIASKIIVKNDFKSELVELKTKLDQDSAERVVYANSITFTPGTFTIDADDENIMIVHAFTPGIAKDLKSGEMEKQVSSSFV